MSSIVSICEFPDYKDWVEVKRRALVTVGKTRFSDPTFEWKRNILRAKHSPIRYLRFSFTIECPYWVSVHLCRHIHAQPYVRSQRNDRQDAYDRNAARQDEMVTMIWDINAEELMTICNKRLCNQASAETREVAEQIRKLVYETCPEFEGFLEPPCVRWGYCDEMYPCGKSR